jgi:hypothetical protein
MKPYLVLMHVEELRFQNRRGNRFTPTTITAAFVREAAQSQARMMEILSDMYDMGLYNGHV